MAFVQTLTDAMRAMLPQVLLYLLLAIIPFIVAEQVWPIGERPRWRDYSLNLLISVSGAYLSLPAAIAAALWSAQLGHVLPWQPFSFTFHSIDAVPVIGPALALLAMVFVPLVSRDMWFYWAHRIEHKVPILWAFHRIHHAADPAYHNKNFADALPIFDMLFGTYHRPARDEFPSSGLGPQFPAPRSLWSAQFGPLLALCRLPLQRGRKRGTPSLSP